MTNTKTVVYFVETMTPRGWEDIWTDENGGPRTFITHMGAQTEIDSYCESEGANPDDYRVKAKEVA